MKKKFGEKRFFLNPKEGVAAGYFYVEVEGELLPNKDRWPMLDSNASIELSDCNRKISLEFDIWVSDSKAKTLKEIKDKRAKVERLRILINEFADAVDASYDYLESQLDAYYKTYAEKKKKNKKKNKK